MALADQMGSTYQVAPTNGLSIRLEFELDVVPVEELVDGTEELVRTLEEVLVTTEEVVATDELVDVFTLEDVVATELDVVGQPFTTP
jgi:hypothetical protein